MVDLGKLEPGAVLNGRYRLEQHLGRGGMGTVWLATDEDLDGLPVATKLLLPDYANDTEYVASLKDEAKNSMRLTHPNIVRVFNFHRGGDDGPTFLVLKYVEGSTMKEVLHDSPQGLPVERVTAWAEQIAAALDYAHSQDVIHRDIKPSNIMIDSDSDAALLMDFGISRQSDRTVRAGSASGTSAGTPAYMSPQQLHDKDGPSNDIYSFAATLYEALNGRAPFGGTDIEEQILRVQPKPIHEVPDHINRAILAGLAKEEIDRPATATELVDMLKSGGPTPAGEPVPAPAETQQADTENERAKPKPAPSAASHRSSPLPALIAFGGVIAAGIAVGSTDLVGDPIRTMVNGPAPVSVPMAQPSGPAGATSQVVASLPVVDLESKPVVDMDAEEPAEVLKPFTADDAPDLIESIRTGKKTRAREILDAAGTRGGTDALVSTVDPQSGRTALLTAAAIGADDVVRMLIDSGAKVGQPGGFPEQTALHVAAGAGHADTVRTLISLGADVNATDAGSNTPLHDAAAACRSANGIEVLRLLLEAQAAADALNKNGKTARELVPLTSPVRDAAQQLLE